MSAIELFSNKDENELMVSFNLDEEKQTQNVIVTAYIPAMDIWLDIDHINNSRAFESATRTANSLIESYLMNLNL